MNTGKQFTSFEIQSNLFFSLPTSQSSINISSQPPHPLPRRSSIEYAKKFNNERHTSTQTYDTMPTVQRRSNQTEMSKRFYDIPVIIERPTRFVIPPFDRYDKSTSSMINDDDDEQMATYDNLSKSDGMGQFRFVIPFNHSPRSAFTTIKPTNSPTDSSSTISSNSTLPQTSSSSNYSNTNNNNNSNHRRRLMTAV